MMNETISVDCKCSDKVKIIALTGKAGCGLHEVKDFLTSHRNVSSITRVEAVDTNSFLNKIIKGQIVEASCDKNDIVWGTDISTCLTCCLYVGIYTPEQIANIRDSGAVEILPIVIDMPAEARILHMLGVTTDPSLTKCSSLEMVTDTCKRFLKSEEEFDDILDYLDTKTALFYTVDDHRDLDMNLKYASFILAMKSFNREHNFITDLDNFI